MEFRIQRIFTFLVLALVASDAASSPELYWKSVLLNTPMPNAVKNLLKPGNYGTTKTQLAEAQPGFNNINYGKSGQKHYGTSETQLAEAQPSFNNINYGKSGQKHYGTSETQLHDHHKGAIFFLEKDIHTGNVMNFHFTKSKHAATFLPRDEANSIPFSSSKFSEVFDHFSVKPGLLEAKLMKNTVKECEDLGIEGEEKFCATSLESMIDFSTSKLGKNVQAVSTEVGKEIQKEKFTITGVKKIGNGKKDVACHKQNYPCTVFYCHVTGRARVYMVQLVGVDGTKTKAVAVCHTNTRTWNPKHLAFQLLKVKPGTVPICHFLAEANVVWVRN